MSTVIKSIADETLNAGPAANADMLGETRGLSGVDRLAETATGWDAYDVWRRFIKEARERRKPGGSQD